MPLGRGALNVVYKTLGRKPAKMAQPGTKGLVAKSERKAYKKVLGAKGVDEGVATEAYRIGMGEGVKSVKSKYKTVKGKPNRAYPR